MKLLKTIGYTALVIFVVNVFLSLANRATALMDTSSQDHARICKAQGDTAFFAAQNRASGHSLKQTLQVIEISKSGMSTGVVKQVDSYLVPIAQVVYSAPPLSADKTREIILKRCNNGWEE